MHQAPPSSGPSCAMTSTMEPKVTLSRVFLCGVIGFVRVDDPKSDGKPPKIFETSHIINFADKAALFLRFTMVKRNILTGYGPSNLVTK